MQDFDIVKFGAMPDRGESVRFNIYTSLKDIKSLISEIEEEFSLPNADFSTMKELCYKIICRLPVPIQTYQKTFVIRCRANYHGQIFSSVDQISYNKSVDKVFLGRFNLDGEPVFYSSVPINGTNANGALGSILETCKGLFDADHKIMDQDVTISRFNVIKPIPLLLLTFYDVAEAKSEYLKKMNPPFREFIQGACSAEDYEKCYGFYSFISKKAGARFDTRNGYLLTTAFFHAAKEYYGREIGIMYSSSMTDNHGLNIVLSRELIDANYLNPDFAIMYRCVRNPQNPTNFLFPIISHEAKINRHGNFIIRQFPKATIKKELEQLIARPQSI